MIFRAKKHCCWNQWKKLHSVVVFYPPYASYENKLKHYDFPGKFCWLSVWFDNILLFYFDREDFEKTGVSSLVTVGVRDIQGDGFPDEFLGMADSVFLDLPQPWLAIPSCRKMLKPDGVLCSFSPCIEQVQRSSETLRSNFAGQFFFSTLWWNFLFAFRFLYVLSAASEREEFQ